MTTPQVKALIEGDPDFIYSKRFDFSLKRLLERHPDGSPDRIVAAVLMITEDDVEARYRQVVAKLRRLMGVGDSL